MKTKSRLVMLVVTAAAIISAWAKDITLLNVSYDPTRELWRDINDSFSRYYERQKGDKVTIKQSHGGSSTQARAVIDGLEADVVTLASYLDTDAIGRKKLIKEGWIDRLPNRSLPYFSTIIFVVRKGNPKRIKDWPDLVKPGISIVTPNPKTSGNGYLSFFSAWGSVTVRGGSRDDAIDFVTKMYKQVPSSRFRRPWRNHHLKYLYTDEAQEIIARHFYRPINEAILNKNAATFPDIELFPITAIAKDFPDAHKQFIGEGGVFDTIYKPK